MGQYKLEAEADSVAKAAAGLDRLPYSSKIAVMRPIEQEKVEDIRPMTNLAKEIECIADKCKIFTKDNSKTGINLIPGMFPLATTSGEQIIIDFTDMGEQAKGKMHLLVMVGSYSGWPEA